MRHVPPISVWFAQIPNLAAYVLAGVVAAVASGAVVRWIGHLSGSNPGYYRVDQSGVPPGVRTAEYYAAAWRDRRQRFFVLRLVQFSSCALILTGWAVSPKHPYVSGRVVLLVFAAWLTAYIAAGVWLNRFRCPRCGKLYYWRLGLKGSAERQKRWRDCHWCGLQQDQCPTDGPSSRAAASRGATDFGEPSITEAPNASPVPALQVKTIAPEKHSVALIVGPIALLVLLTGLGYFKLYDHHFRACPAFSAALELMARSSAAQAALGEPIHVDFAVRGVVHDDHQAGYAILTIPVHGPTAEGLLYVIANRDGRNWDIERAVLHSDNGSRKIDLTPAVQPERFRYPAPGRVYLLPLDKTAVSGLQGLPQYFKDRLGLNATLLPPQQLPADAVDPKTKRVIAEKAVQSIAEENSEIANDLDSVIVGVTNQDMNIWTTGWTFATNYRVARIGIVSTARLHGMPWYAGPNPEVFAVRVRKMVTKNVALLEYPV
jgi:Cytochrome oxidase complex assembly protein 1